MWSHWFVAHSGVKKSLVLVPGTSWISGRTSIYFHPMSGRQVKNSMLVYFSLTRTSYLVTGQVKILMHLPGGQVKIFRFFYPWHFTGTWMCVYVSIYNYLPLTWLWPFSCSADEGGYQRSLTDDLEPSKSLTDTNNSNHQVIFLIALLALKWK